jgi:hypothetical protein
MPNEVSLPLGTLQLESAEVADMTWQEAEKQIAAIKETLKWHARIGWTAIVLTGILAGSFVRWYLPKELEAQKNAIVGAIKLDINKIAKLQLTKLSAQIEDAKKQNITIESATLISLNNGLADIAVDSTPEIAQLAAKTNGELLSYKSFLNVSYEPAIANPIRIGASLQFGKYHFSLNTKPNPKINAPTVWVVRVSTSGIANPDSSARLESLAEPQPQGSGAGLILVEGKADSIVLDNEYMKNVVIKDAVVEYDGGPMRLENVYFVNCTFILPTADEPKIHEFTTALLAKVPTTFRTPEA